MNKINDALDSLENLVDYILLDDFRTEEERRAVHESKQTILDALDLLRRDELVLSWFKEHIDEKETWASGSYGSYGICFNTNLSFEPSEPASATKDQCEAFQAWLG